MSVVIHTKNLCKTYIGRDIPALNAINIDIHKGEIFGILGPNGAGKSTLLSILYGGLKASSGEINVLGLTYKNNRKEILQKIGVIPQEYALYPTLTARENLNFFGRLFGLPKKELKNKIEEYLDKTGLISFADKKIETFSGGMKRRINILCAILHQPEIIFLDEPTVGVDIQSKKAIMSLLKEAHENGATLVYTSHLLNEAQDFCTNIAILDHSEIVKIGAPGDLINQVEAANNLEDVFLHYTGHQLRDYV